MKKKKIRSGTRAFYAALSYLSPALNTKLLFLRKFGRLPELRQPKTLNEKLLKLKLEQFGTDELVAVYDRVKDVQWELLPERFAMKWNFGCGYNIICQDKAKLDIPATVKQLKKWGREPFWAYYSELQYRNVEKKLIVEEYIGDGDGRLPEDYKFYCFNGKDYCCMVCQGREEGWPKFYFMDRDFQLLRINRDSKNAPEGFALPKPRDIDRAYAVADTLSRDFPFVRVDLYLTEKGVRFGEMTFTPAAALDNKRLPETDLMFGGMMEI